MYDQIREDTLYIILYSIVTAMNAMASIYLLFRRGNAFAADITPPVRLRRWTAAFFAVLAIGHLWYIPAVMFDSREAAMVSMLIGALLDCILIIPLALGVMLCMLQDRRRPLWPIGAMVAPLVVGMVVCIVTRSDALLPWVRGYFLLTFIGFTVYLVGAVRQYGRWLRDNYADLEHKEVWQSFLVLAFMMIIFGYYVSGDGGMFYEYTVQVFGLFLVFYLLWRVETLSDLSIPLAQKDDDSSQTFRSNIGPLLKQYCEDSQLYLQHDISVSQLASLIGVNRSYLSKHFASQGITYNAYINGLRIRHFVDLYHELAAAHQPITAQQLAHQSGFHSYSTFSAAFKQIMGTTATEWMRAANESA